MRLPVGILRFCMAGVVCLSLAGLPAFAKPPWAGGGGGKPENAEKWDKGNSGRHKDDTYGGIANSGITVTSARSIASDYRLTGAKPLPPGIQKNLGRGKPLPPGIAKKVVPGPMLTRLPVHPGYEWHSAGADLILVQVKTSIVADILRGVFR